MHKSTTLWLVVVGVILIASICKAQDLAEAPVAALIPNCDVCTDACQPSCGELHAFALNAFVCQITPATQYSFAGGSNPSFEGLMSTTPFPGRTEPGWIGSTTIVIARQRLLNGVQTLVCDTINVDIAENVLVGPCVVDAATGIVTINGVIGQPVNDPEGRLEAAAGDDLGFPIDINSIAPGVVTPGCSLAGYGASGQFFYHTFSFPLGLAALTPDAPFVSATLAQCRTGQELRLAGGTRGQFSNGAVIEAYMADRGIPDRSALLPEIAVSEGLTAGFGTWDMRIEQLPGFCPSHVLLRIRGQTGPQFEVLVPTFLR